MDTNDSVACLSITFGKMAPKRSMGSDDTNVNDTKRAKIVKQERLDGEGANIVEEERLDGEGAKLTQKLKRPVNPYFYYSKEESKKFKAAGISVTDQVKRQMGGTWHELPKDGRAKFVALGNESKKAYQTAKGDVGPSQQKVVKKFDTRCSPQAVYNLISGFMEEPGKAVEECGFGELLSLPNSRLDKVLLAKLIAEF